MRSPAARMAAPGWARGSVPAQVRGLAKPCSIWNAVAGAGDESDGVCFGLPDSLTASRSWCPAGRRIVSCRRTWPSWWARAQIALPLPGPGRTRMRRAVHSVVPSAGQPGSRSTAKPSLLASQHRQSHRPGGISSRIRRRDRAARGGTVRLGPARVSCGSACLQGHDGSAPSGRAVRRSRCLFRRGSPAGRPSARPHIP